MQKKIFKVVGAYDTETTNIFLNGEWSAYPVLFITNDIRGVDLREYKVGMGKIYLDREPNAFLSRIETFIEDGKTNGYVPVVCAYNLLFDLQPVMYLLSKRYEMTTIAQSSTTCYTLDLMEGDDPVLRFWDTFHLELNGLYAMGRACGLEKLDCWDYELIRTPETPLTENEKAYAGRDTEVIPAYLRFLLESYSWLTPEMLGCQVLTKSSLVRQMAKKEIGGKKIKTSKKKRASLGYIMRQLCKQELPPDFNVFGLRRACFRGGFTFTAANNAMQVWERVCSLDVTSMHHTFIQGRKIPIQFRKANPAMLKIACENIINTTLPEVLMSYSRPFEQGIHALIRFDNLRLKEGSVFERDGIATLARSKFSTQAPESDYTTNDYNLAEDEYIKSYGFRDKATRGKFAFSKIMGAETAYINVTEVELWNMSRVYEWDKMTPIYGEVTSRWDKPPDYVMAQSMKLYLQKNEMKDVVKHYNETPYRREIGKSIPDGIKEGLRKGELSKSFVESYYNSSIKGSFNGIYGVECMSLFRPGFIVKDGAISVDPYSIVTADNYDEKLAEIIDKPPLVLYNYGMRIVGGSRQHLVIAMELIYNKLGDKVHFLGGDTDSVKISIEDGTDVDDVLAALKPLHIASTNAIKDTTSRCVDTVFNGEYPETTIGHFEVEPASEDSIYYDYHMEFWNKARVSCVNDQAHITFAGLPRPDGVFNIEELLTEKIKKLGFEKAVSMYLGYNLTVCPELSHTLEHKKPKANEIFEGDVEDYTGANNKVRAYKSIALYPSPRCVGDTNKAQNAENIGYLRLRGMNPNTDPRYINFINGEWCLLDYKGDIIDE